MRHQLAPLENQMVVYVGRAADHKRHGDEVHLCLTNVKLWRVDRSTAMNTTPPIARVDHLWLAIEPSSVEKAEMFTQRSGAGRVSMYARANGSVDYCIKPVQGCYLDRLNDLLYECDCAPDAVSLIGDLLKRYEDPENIFYGSRKSPELWIKHFRRQYDRWMRSACTNAARHILAPAHGRCTAVKETLGLPKQDRRQAVGFA